MHGIRIESAVMLRMPLLRHLRFETVIFAQQTSATLDTHNHAYPFVLRTNTNLVLRIRWQKGLCIQCGCKLGYAVSVVLLTIATFKSASMILSRPAIVAVLQKLVSRRCSSLQLLVCLCATTVLNSMADKGAPVPSCFFVLTEGRRKTRSKVKT